MEERAVLLLDRRDNVAVALRGLAPGELIRVGGQAVTVQEPIPTGHKVALQTIPDGGTVIKYGEGIGEARRGIGPGQHVHVHNVRDITAEVVERERRRMGL